MEAPDVIGFTLHKARTVLQQAGICIDSISVTSPPRESGQPVEDSFRVLKVKIVENLKVELIVCKPL